MTVKLLLFLGLFSGLEGATVLRLACGGTGGSDAAGNIWSADSNFVGGTSWGPVQQPAMAAQPIPYRNLRYSAGTAPFTYTLNFAPGSYNVTLKWIEPNKTAAGQRLFQATISPGAGTPGIDIFALAGGALKPYDKTYAITTTSGQIIVAISGSVGNGILSGIQVDSVPAVSNPWIECQHIAASDVPAPSTGSRIFCDSSNGGKLTRKDSTGAIFPVEGAAASGSGQVKAFSTNTQTALAFDGAAGVPCRVLVSETPGGQPIHDVDSALFADADLDSRPGSLVMGAHRIFVVGKPVNEAALDGNIYSRAQQAFTTHYYAISGCVSASGSYKTANIPLGNTYSDVAPTNAPTLSFTDRSQKIIDARTGALIRRVSLPKDQVSAYDAINGPFTGFGGFTRMCGHKLVGPGPGYLCSFPNGDGAFGLFYYIIPSTGQVMFLGSAGGQFGGLASQPKIDPIDNKIYVSSPASVISYAYAGDYSGAPQGSFAAFTSEVFVPSSLSGLIKAFDPTIDILEEPVLTVDGAYGLIVMGSGQQDSYGSMAVLDMGNRLPIGSCGPDPMACPHIVAAANTSKQPATRWCGLHTIAPMTGDTLQPLIFQSYHELVGPYVNGPQTFGGTKENGYWYDTVQAGTGPFYTRLVGAISVGQTSIVVDGEPLSPNAPISHLQDVSVGDWIILRSTDSPLTNDKYQVVSKADAQHWTISPPAVRAMADRSRVIMTCKGNWLSIWKFLDDPHGSDTTNTKIVFNDNWPLGGHDDWGPFLRLTEGYEGIAGAIQDHLGDPINFTTTVSPSFAGVTGKAYGTSVGSHPSYHQVNVSSADSSWFLDSVFMQGDQELFNAPFTLVSSSSSQLWKLGPVANSYQWNPKVLGTFGLTAKRGLIDVSGPRCSISDTTADVYKYGIVVKAGECHAGSLPGEVYANVAASTGACTGNWDINDICIIPQPTLLGVVQVGSTQPDTPTGAYSRLLSNGFSRPRRSSGLETAKSLPDASWALFNLWDYDTLWDTGHVPPWTNQLTKQVFMVKLPPYTKDGIDRSTFIRQPISIAVPGSLGIATAAVEFGYTVFGDASKHYCQQRAESCFAVDSTVTDANPFYWASETYTRQPCATSCTITLPVLPAHTAYYTVKFYDAAGVFVQNGETGVVMETQKVPLGAALAPSVLAPTVVSGQDIPSPSGGDTNYVAWVSAAIKPGTFAGGSLIGMYNDGKDSPAIGMCDGFGGGNSLCVYQMTAYDKANVANTKFSVINNMRSYGSFADTSCFDRVRQMKSRKVFALKGKLYVPIFCMNGPAPAAGQPWEAFQSGMIVSPDGGAHWCNYKTYTSGGNTCTSANWQDNADNPVDATGFQWPLADGTNKVTRPMLVDFLCQDNAIGCPTAAGVDPSYLYFLASDSLGAVTTVMRVLKTADPMLPASWNVYNSGAWSADPQSATDVGGSTGGIGCCGAGYYLKDFSTFAIWQHPNGFATAPAPWGPWTAGAPILPPRQGFPGPVAGLCPKYDVAGRVTCTAFGAPNTDLSIYEEDLGPVSTSPPSLAKLETCVSPQTVTTSCKSMYRSTIKMSDGSTLMLWGVPGVNDAGSTWVPVQ